MAIDIDCIDDTEKYGGFSQKEVDSRGRLDLLYEDAHVRAASDRVKKSGVLELLAKWHAEDHPNSRGGGRPRIINHHAILVGLLLLQQEFSSLYLRDLSIVFERRLSSTARSLLRLPEPDVTRSGKLSEREKWEKNTNNAFHRMLKLMDPYPMKRYKALTYTQVQAVLDAHDEEREVLMKARADAFTEALLRMTFYEQPRRLRRASKNIDLSGDQTFLAPPTTKGYSKKTIAARIRAEAAGTVDKPTPGPVDPFAAWYAKHDDDARLDLKPGSKDATSPGSTAGTRTKLVWGWVANTTVRVDSEHPGAHRFPGLAIATTLSMPNVGVSEEAVKLMRFSLDRGLPPGIFDADKQYFANATVERLHQPTADLGFTPSTEYRVDRLGVQGGKGGAEYIEGGVYCPGMPKGLKDASKDVHTGVIDVQTYLERIRQRKAFELHAKERPDANGKQPLSCPALGDSPTVTCPLRELAKKAAQKPRPGVEKQDLPEFLDKICRQHSVTFSQQDLIRQKQALPYQSKEWNEFHDHARQSIESMHEGFKDPGKENLENPQCRKVRGFIAAQVFLTIALINYNLRKIAAFLDDEILNAAEQHAGGPAEPTVRRRDRLWHNPYTKTMPRESVFELEKAGLLGSPLRT